MTIILLVYALIVWLEGRYMRKNKRKKRTFALVFGATLLMFLLSEALHLLRNDFQIASLIQAVFGPLERLAL